MARSNVGTPKFYIDYLQYWHAKGLVFAIGPYAEHTDSDNSNGIDWLDETVQGGTAYRPELIGLDPSNYTVDERQPYNYTSAMYLRYYVSLKERVYLPDSGKFWFGMLNHNFAQFSDVINPCYHLNVYKNMGGGYDTGVSFADSSDYPYNYTSSGWWHGYSLTDGANEISNCNGTTSEAIQYNGFTISEFEHQSEVQAANDYNSNTPSATFNGTTYTMPGFEYGAGFDIFIATCKINLDPSNYDMAYWRLIQGTLNFGGVYEMPNSPDLKLSMTREYGGADKQETLSGHSFRNIRYSGPANWRNDLPAWHLTVDDSNELKRVKGSSKGRRIWNLEFSYIGSDDIFALNESSSVLNPTNSSTAGGYDSTDFETGTTNFTKNIYNDDSFFGVVIEKTMGGTLPFIFMPDSSNNSPDQYAICVIDQESIDFEQVAPSTYNISLKIKEVW